MSLKLTRKAAAALAGILIAVGGCGESPSAVSTQPHFLRVAPAPSFVRLGTPTSAVIGPDGGTLQTWDGHRLVFPAGAVSQPTTISISSDPTFVGVTLEPHGLQFPAGSEPVLTLNLGRSIDIPGLRAAVVYVTDGNVIAEQLPSGQSGGTLQASLHHFSRYLAVGG